MPMQNNRGSLPGVWRAAGHPASVLTRRFACLQNESDIADAIEQGVWEPREAFFITSKIGPAQVPTAPAVSPVNFGHMHMHASRTLPASALSAGSPQPWHLPGTPARCTPHDTGSGAEAGQVITKGRGG